MTDEDGTSPGVRIGNVSGGIHGSVIAGRDVSGTTITVGEKTMRADQTPTREDLAELMADIRKTLAEVLADKEQLAAVSAAAPYAVLGATESVNAAAEHLSGDVSPDDATSVHRSLTDAAKLIGTVADTTDQDTSPSESKDEGAASKIKSIGEKLGPLVKKLAVAAVWVAKLWLSIPGA